MKRRQNQKGFTIIELVIVVLLLGILAATALPRFIDMTDEARVAAVRATAGGLATGAALFRAQAIADGVVSSATNVGGDFLSFGLTANQHGYPAASDAAGCISIYTALLQSGRAEVSSGAVFNSNECTYSLIGDLDGYGITLNLETGDVGTTP